jgi:hypothetical protein
MLLAALRLGSIGKRAPTGGGVRIEYRAAAVNVRLACMHRAQ